MGRQKKQHLAKRPDGRYRCKYHDMYFYGRTEDEALAAREDYIRSERKGSPRQTVSDYALPWIKRTFPAVADTTYTGLAIHLQHLIDRIGSKQISEVIPSDIKGVYSEEYSDCSASYIKSARQLYCSLFDSAVADGLIRSNPARDKTAKPHRGAGVKTRPVTDQERAWIETLCTDHRMYPAVMTMLYAGVRPPEVKAIKIERDVDFTANTITLHEFPHRDGAKYEYNETGKTKNAARTIPLFPPLREVLKGRKGYIITSAHGEMVTPTSWRVAWRSYCYEMETAINGMPRRWYGKTREHKAMIAAGKELPPWVSFDIVPYSLRKGFCIMVRDSGAEMNVCRKWMGHTDARMILQVYDSVTDSRSENERKKVEKLLNRGQNGGQEEKQWQEPVDK